MGMKKMACILFSAFCVTTCLTGCFSIEKAHVPDGSGDHLVVRNYGWYLFNCIPIGCGNASEDPLFPVVLFRDDVEMEKIQTIFTEYAALRGKKPTELAYDMKEDVMFMIPTIGYSVTVPIPNLLTYREVQLSGVLQ